MGGLWVFVGVRGVRARDAIMNGNNSSWIAMH